MPTIETIKRIDLGPRGDWKRIWEGSENTLCLFAPVQTFKGLPNVLLGVGIDWHENRLETPLRIYEDHLRRKNRRCNVFICGQKNAWFGVTDKLDKDGLFFTSPMKDLVSMFWELQHKGVTSLDAKFHSYLGGVLVAGLCTSVYKVAGEVVNHIKHDKLQPEFDYLLNKKYLAELEDKFVGLFVREVDKHPFLSPLVKLTTGGKLDQVNGKIGLYNPVLSLEHGRGIRQFAARQIVYKGPLAPLALDRATAGMIPKGTSRQMKSQVQDGFQSRLDFLDKSAEIYHPNQVREDTFLYLARYGPVVWKALREALPNIKAVLNPKDPVGDSVKILYDLTQQYFWPLWADKEWEDKAKNPHYSYLAD